MRRISELLLTTSTEYAELLLSVLSTLAGIWLLLPVCHVGFHPWQLKHCIPECWGIMLLLSGLLKLYGVFQAVFRVRQISCGLATLVWLFLAWTFFLSDRPEFGIMAAPLTLVLAIFNALIYIKLWMVTR
jgi:hypothetical protein